MGIRGGFLLNLSPPTGSTWKDNSKLVPAAGLVNLTGPAHMEGRPKQPLIFLILDFSKAYDMVTWRFLFWAMEALSIPLSFINMMKLLF